MIKLLDMLFDYKYGGAIYLGSSIVLVFVAWFIICVILSKKKQPRYVNATQDIIKYKQWDQNRRNGNE